MSSSTNKAKIDYFLLSIYLFFMCLGIMAAYYTKTFPQFTMSNDVGAARFPLIFSGSLSVLCLLRVLKTLFMSNGSLGIPQGINKAIVAMALNAMVVFFIPIIGFYLATFIFSILLMVLLGVTSKTKIMMVSFGVIVGIYVVFQVLLKVPLPLGIFFE